MWYKLMEIQLLQSMEYKKKDVLLEVDGIALEKMCDLRSYIYTKKPGMKLLFKVLRNKKRNANCSQIIKLKK